jgi:PPOX class probable F420-dependent enzyme
VDERTLEQLPSWAVELLDRARVAHLGLLDGQARPRVLPITFAVVAGAVWSAVDDKPKRRSGEDLARVGWLRARPASALTVDHYDADWTRLAWVQILGSTSVLEPAGQDPVMEALAARYPPYRARSPRGPLLRLVPERVICWSARDAT